MLVLVPLPLPKDAAGAHLPTLLQGNPPSRALRSSLLRFGEHPRGYPDVASGRCTGTLRQRGRERLPGKRGRTRTVPQRGKAVSSELYIRVPEAERGRVPCRNEDEHRPSNRATYVNEERSVRIPQDTDGAFYLRDQLLSDAEVGQQERVIPRNLTPTRWSMQIPSARGTKSACGRVYAVGVP